jgi:hypothetical protein
MEQEKLSEEESIWEKRERDKERIHSVWLNYEDERALSQGDMKCAVTKEWVDKDWCDSFARGIGCKYKGTCVIYKILSEREGN